MTDAFEELSERYGSQPLCDAMRRHLSLAHLGRALALSRDLDVSRRMLLILHLMRPVGKDREQIKTYYRQVFGFVGSDELECSFTVDKHGALTVATDASLVPIESLFGSASARTRAQRQALVEQLAADAAAIARRSEAAILEGCQLLSRAIHQINPQHPHPFRFTRAEHGADAAPLLLLEGIDGAFVTSTAWLQQSGVIITTIQSLAKPRAAAFSIPWSQISHLDLLKGAQKGDQLAVHLHSASFEAEALMQDGSPLRINTPLLLALSASEGGASPRKALTAALAACEQESMLKQRTARTTDLPTDLLDELSDALPAGAIKKHVGAVAPSIEVTKHTDIGAAQSTRAARKEPAMSTSAGAEADGRAAQGPAETKRRAAMVRELAEADAPSQASQEHRDVDAVEGARAATEDFTEYLNFEGETAQEPVEPPAQANASLDAPTKVEESEHDAREATPPPLIRRSARQRSEVQEEPPTHDLRDTPQRRHRREMTADPRGSPTPSVAASKASSKQPKRQAPTKRNDSIQQAKSPHKRPRRTFAHAKKPIEREEDASDDNNDEDTSLSSDDADGDQESAKGEQDSDYAGAQADKKRLVRKLPKRAVKPAPEPVPKQVAQGKRQTRGSSVKPPKAEPKPTAASKKRSAEAPAAAKSVARCGRGSVLADAISVQETPSLSEESDEGPPSPSPMPCLQRRTPVPLPAKPSRAEDEHSSKAPARAVQAEAKPYAKPLASPPRQPLGAMVAGTPRRTTKRKRAGIDSGLSFESVRPQSIHASMAFMEEDQPPRHLFRRSEPTQAAMTSPDGAPSVHARSAPPLPSPTWDRRPYYPPPPSAPTQQGASTQPFDMLAVLREKLLNLADVSRACGSDEQWSFADPVRHVEAHLSSIVRKQSSKHKVSRRICKHGAKSA